MELQDKNRLGKILRSLVQSDYLKLVLVLALALYLAFIPHQGYQYPVHVDEWVHMALSTELLDNGGTDGLTSPFTGKNTEWNQRVELGFHLFWGIFQEITSIPWVSIIRYFPAIIFMITVLSVYALCRKAGFGWEAALFACLVPTAIGILGPGFLVPVAIGMVFIPLTLFTLFYLRGWQSYVLLLLFFSLMMLTHAATAVSMIIIFSAYILLSFFKNERKHALAVVITLMLPFASSLLFMRRIVLNKIGSLFVTQPLPQHVDLPLDFATYGYLPTIIFAIGIFSLIRSGGSRNHGLAFGSLALLTMVITFVKFHYGVELVYLRGFVHLQLMMGVVAGSGLLWLRNIRLPDSLGARVKPAFISRNIGGILGLIVIVLTLIMVVPSRQNTIYYHMIDKHDYDAFAWIAENVEEYYDKAILDPWKATAFTAITGRKIYSKIVMSPGEDDMRAYEFLGKGCLNTAFLRNNNITIVYTRQQCENPDLINVRRYVYLLEATSPIITSSGSH